jgi:hypothetical protein
MEALFACPLSIVHFLCRSTMFSKYKTIPLYVFEEQHNRGFYRWLSSLLHHVAQVSGEEELAHDQPEECGEGVDGRGEGGAGGQEGEGEQEEDGAVGTFDCEITNT